MGYTVLRWIIMLPVAVGACMLAMLLNGVTMTWYMSVSWDNHIVQFSNSYLGAVALVYVGARIAPAHHFTVALAMTAILVFILGGSLALTALGYASTPAWEVAVSGTLMLLGAVMVCVGISRGELD